MSEDAAGKLAAAQAPARRRLWFKLIATLAPTLIGLGLIAALMIHQERLVVGLNPFVFRIQKPPIYVYEKGHEVTGHRYLYDELLGWKNIPNWKATTRGRPLTINSKGLRDREYPYEKPPGVKRILVLGDSFVWGYGVGDSEIFTEVLERQLQAEGRPWEVINTGVSGWGTDQEYLFFREEGVKYSPDIVVLAYYFGNDWGNNCAEVQYGLGKPCFTDTNLTEIIPPVLNPGRRDKYSETLKVPDMTLALIRAIHDLCRRHNARLVVLIFGAFGTEPGSQTDRVARELMPLMMEQARRRGIQLLDVDRTFAASGVSAREVFEGNVDGHWNAFGHALVARMLHKLLEPLL